MKAVLVVDVPSDMPVEDTKALHITLFNGLFTKDLSINQQLRPLPKQFTMDEILMAKDVKTAIEMRACNDCLEEITGETE